MGMGGQHHAVDCIRGREPATCLAGVCDEFDAIDDYWDYYRIVFEVSLALGSFI
jgi:hypothetical protein